MVAFAAHLPWTELALVGLGIDVVGSSVEPVSVAVDVEVLEVFELIKWVVLEIVGLYTILELVFHLLICSSSPGSGSSSNLLWSEILVDS